MTELKKALPGIGFVLAISAISMAIDKAFEGVINLEVLTIAIVIGMVYNNFIGTQKVFDSGVKFSLKKLLKVGIVLLGFKLNIKVMIELGPQILMLVITYVFIALVGSFVLGKIFGVNNRLSALIGVGSSICGASAVMAMAPCVNAEDEEAIIAVSIVSFLGAIGVMIYSSIAVSPIDMSAVQYGTWSGLSLHGVAHAIAAAFAMGDQAGEIGTLVKMTRVLMLVPVSFILSYLFNRSSDEKRKHAGFPMYVLYFVIASVINTMGIIPTEITSLFTKTSSFLILMAMTSMGLSVDFKSIVTLGLKSLVAGTLLFIVLSVGSFSVIMFIL